ncbi:MAG: Fur family transcriptional regulator [Patescibacteria group bacterium]
MRLTKHRQEIINTLKKSHGTLSAQDIHKLIPTIDIVTIYRNLDLFVAEGIIKKLHLEGNEAKYEYQAHPHHHAICNSCDRVIHFNASEAQLREVLNVPDFDITTIDLVVRGRCHHDAR